MPLVLVTGLPGSGKTTVSAALADELRLPLIAKDRFKEVLFDTLGAADIAWSQRIGAAAIALQYEMMRTVKDAVVDSALWTDRSEPEVLALGLPLVQVYCDCPFDVARDRFFDRLAGGNRHPGFAETEMSRDDYDRFSPLSEPLRLPNPLVRVPTTEPLTATRLGVVVAEVRRALDVAR